MKRQPTKYLALLSLWTFFSTVTLAQDWKSFHITEAGTLQALIEAHFGVGINELPTNEITHVKLSCDAGQFNSSDNNAFKKLAAKAKEVDLGDMEVEDMNTLNLSRLDSLVRIVLPKTAKSVAYMNYCNKLQTIVWPEALERIESNAFYRDEGLKRLDLPATLTAIGNYAFENCSSLETVVCNEGLTTLGNECFRSCTNLTSIHLPSTLTTLGSGMFQGCRSLEHVDIPESVTELNTKFMFSGCAKLKEFTIPACVTTIGASMFSSCRSLENIVFPDGLTEIGNNAFESCDSLKHLTLPDSITTINEYAFERCPNLVSIHLPDALTTLGKYVFAYDAALETIHLPEGLTAISSCTFDGCKALQSINLPESITEIGSYAFRNVPIEHYQLPPALKSIGSNAFLNGIFTEMTLPETLTQLGPSCFEGCENLQSIKIPQGVQAIPSRTFQNCKSLLKVELNEGLTQMGESVFKNCTSLSDISLPSTVRLMDYYIFENCDSLKRLVLPPALRIVPCNLCASCNNLEEVVLPPHLLTIDDGAFEDTNLQHIDLPEGLKTIGIRAFSKAPLEEVAIPASVRTIKVFAFRDGKYSRIEIPEGVETIERDAFSSPNLRVVIFPSTLYEASQPLIDGPQLDSIVYYAAIPPQNGGFSNRQLASTLYVPEKSIDLYKNHEGYQFANIKGLSMVPSSINITGTLRTDSAYYQYQGVKIDISLLKNTEGYRPKGSHFTIAEGTTQPIGHLLFTHDYSYGSLESWNDDCTFINEGEASATSMSFVLKDVYTGHWAFLVAPFDFYPRDITSSYSGQAFAIRRYDSQAHANGTLPQAWVNIGQDELVKAGTGFIFSPSPWPVERVNGSIYSENGHFTFPSAKNGVLNTHALANGDVTIPLINYKGEYAFNEGWNFVGNPYLCYYDIEKFDTDAPIFVYGPYNTSGFTAYSPLDDEFILPPMRGFFIQASDELQNITFKADGRQDNAEVHHESENSARALRRAIAREHRTVINVFMDEADSTLARTRVVINPAMTTGYDASHDAAFMSFDNQEYASLYTYAEGVRYAINERPIADGTVCFGMRFSKPGTYTLRLNSQSAEQIILTDHLTGERIDMSQPYTFETAAGTFDQRFTLQVGDGITAVETIEQSPVTIDHYYDLQGRRVKNMGKGIFLWNGKKIIK